MVKLVPLNKIKPNPKNPRYIFEKSALKELADTVKSQGIIHAIEIDEYNMIICGERRWRAAKIAGLKFIPCTVKTGLTDFQKLQRQYVENAQHRDLNIIEKGRAFKTMLKYKKKDYLEKRKEHSPKQMSDYHAKGIKELSDEVGETDWTVRNAMELSEERKLVTSAIENEVVPYTHILEVNKIKDKDIRDEIKKKVLDNDFPSREILKNVVDVVNTHPKYKGDLLKKSGEELREALREISDKEILAKQDIKTTYLIQAMPILEKEYKKFESNSLARFMEYLNELITK